ncbi:hypothetical protein AOQ84DRAFT_388903 [Glonium stellatum]|uniref:C2H2-type domain-containing protein n=1 Tax=Glonium stellatum TaxID=574774 RepID=A0A8E2F141_9PEZI|nr:hypothetical protein AOQ84DRAFT_388903 [Glonium stellatum]
MQKHVVPDQFKCSAINCKRQFPRADKLKDHVRAKHDDDTVFACPVQDCLLATLPMNRPEMCDHLGTFHGEVRQQYKHDFAALGC